MWLPPFLGVYMLMATAKPLARGKAEASVKYLWNLYHRLDIQIQSTSSLSPLSQTECLQFQSDFELLLLGFLPSFLF